MKNRVFAGLTVFTASLLSSSALSAQTADKPVQLAANTNSQVALNADAETVIVVGTRRSDQTTVNSATPVEIIGERAIQDTGVTGLAQALRESIPDFSYSTGGGPIGARGVNNATLKGLSPDDTLVLVNGHRRHLTSRVTGGAEWGRGSQAVDLNTIPVSGIKSVQVLQDGASAQYGTDAIAGVLNVVLRGNDPGGNLSATVGQFDAGDGLSRDVNGWQTIPLGDNGGFINFSGDLRRNNRTNRDNPDARQFYFAGDPREATANRVVGQYGNPLFNSLTLGYNAELPLDDKWTVYSFATSQKRSSNANFRTILPSDDGNVRALYPDGSHGNMTIYYGDAAVTTGVRYKDDEIGTFDLSFGYGTDISKTNVFKSENASLGLATPTSFYLGHYINTQYDLALDYVKDIAVGWSDKPPTLSAGFESRWEDYAISAGDFGSWIAGSTPILDGPHAGLQAPPGSQVAAGISPADAGTYGRNVVGGYIGLEQQVSDSFQFALAGRVENYSDFGTAAAGKASVRYDVLPFLALRASVGNGFKAPTLGQIGQSSTGFSYVTTATAQVLTSSTFLPVANPAARALGSTNLQPETSIDYSAGLVLHPLENAYLTVDGYQVDLWNGLTPTDTLTGAFVTKTLTGAGFPSINSARFYINGVNTRSAGVNITAKYDLDLDDAGALALSVATNYNHNSITHLAPNPAVLAGSGLVLLGRQTLGQIAKWSPDSKWVVGGHYTLGAFSADLTELRYGHYAYVGTVATQDQNFHFQYVTNLALSYAFTDSLKLTVGANNLLNDYPDVPIPVDRFTGYNNYDLQAPEANGGYYFATFSVSF